LSRKTTKKEWKCRAERQVEAVDFDLEGNGLTANSLTLASRLGGLAQLHADGIICTPQRSAIPTQAQKGTATSTKSTMRT